MILTAHLLTVTLPASRRHVVVPSSKQLVWGGPISMQSETQPETPGLFLSSQAAPISTKIRPKPRFPTPTIRFTA